MTEAPGRRSSAKRDNQRNSLWPRLRLARDRAVAHPLLTVLTAATLVRLVAVIAVGPLRPGYIIPDEIQYIGLADSVASGKGAEAWFPGYGQSLYDATGTFMRPLTLLTALFGPHQVVGQLLAASAGVGAAVLTTLLARWAVRPAFALAAGLTVALLPSQVFWSSVVLRESMVWALLATIGLSVPLVARASSRWALLPGFALAALATVLLWDLRTQTAFVAGWALVPAALLAARRHRVLIAVGALAVSLGAPALSGMGVGGLSLAERALPALGALRGTLSVGADSAFVDRTVIRPPSDSAVPASSPSPSPDIESPNGTPGHRPASQAPQAPESPVAASSPGAAQSRGGTVILTGPSGEQIAVENDARATLDALPSGLVAVTLRPMPWEPSSNPGVLLAKLESPAWALLYLLACIGSVVGWRRRDVLAYPFIVTIGIVGVAAVTQGNLGTAFRHRGQVVWALAALAAVGLQYIVDRRRSADS